MLNAQFPRWQIIASGLALVVALATGGLFAFVNAGHAAGGGTTTTQPQNCPQGKVWSASKGKCVWINSSVDDEELYDQGRALAKYGQYERAIEVLSAVSNRNDPRVLNYLGYSHRKLGRLDTGIRYYAKALAINPDFVLAREYLGEGYVAKGDLAKAREQLHEIEKRCGTGCEEYVDLAEAITAASEGTRTN